MRSAAVSGRSRARRAGLSGALPTVLTATPPGAKTPRAASLANRALGGRALLEERTADALEVYLAAAALLYADRYDEAERAMSDALAEARARGSIVGFSVASCFRSRLRFRRGRLDDAEVEGHLSIDAVPDGPWSPPAYATLVDTLRERGDLTGARAVLERADAQTWHPGNAHIGVLLYARGQLSIAEGSVKEGLRDVLVAGTRQLESPDDRRQPGGRTPAATSAADSSWPTCAAPRPLKIVPGTS